MSLDQLLRAAADDVAREVLPPPPDVPGLVRRARRTRRRRAGAAGLAAAAAVAAGVLVAGLVTPEAAPPPASEETFEPGPWLAGAAWLDDGSGLVAGEPVSTVTGEPAGLAVLDGGIVYGLEDGRVLAQRPGEVARQVGRHEGHGPVGGVGGSTAAWLDGSVLVAYDLASGEVTGRVDLGERVGPDAWRSVRGGHLVVSVAADRVRVAAADGAWDWTPGEESVRRVTGVATGRLLDSGAGRQVLAGDRELDSRTGALSLTILEVRTDGETPWSYGPVMPEASLSPDGRYLATRTGYGDGLRLVVLDLEARRAVELEAPHTTVAGVPYPWGWAVGDTLMVRAWAGFAGGEPRERLLACVIGDGSCHVVAGSVEAVPRS